MRRKLRSLHGIEASAEPYESKASHRDEEIIGSLSLICSFEGSQKHSKRESLKSKKDRKFRAKRETYTVHSLSGFRSKSELFSSIAQW